MFHGVLDRPKKDQAATFYSDASTASSYASTTICISSALKLEGFDPCLALMAQKMYTMHVYRGCQSCLSACKNMSTPARQDVYFN